MILSLVAFALGHGLATAKELPSDGRILTGKLKNGVTWMYRQHDNPPGKMGLMLRVDSGSLNESDGQRGLAHFLEHMCFNGSENFPPGALIPYFESIGMEFGADLNAFTSFDQTVYMLYTPDTTTEHVDKALMVLSDYAFRITLLEGEIDKERGVVLEESRTGKNAFQRIRDKLWPELFEGSRFAERLPIGKDEIIAKAPRKEFEDYYRTWYRPEHMQVMLVGDAPAERITPLIEKWFSGYTPKEPARKQEKAGFKPFTKKRAMVVTDPEMAMCQVSVNSLRPGRPSTTTVEQWRGDLVEQIGTWILGRRFQEMVQRGEAAFRNANIRAGRFFDDAVLVQGGTTGEAVDWAKMLDQFVVEAKRAREHGFTQRELDLAKKELMNDAEQAVKTDATRDARELLFEMVFNINEGEPIVSAEQELVLMKELLPTIQLTEVSSTFKDFITPDTFAYTVTMIEKEGVPVPSRDDVLAAADAAWKKPVEAPKQDAAPTDLLAAAPKPGNVEDSKTEKDLGITSAWLSNGVRLHHRFMDYKKNEILISIALAGGSIEETPDNAGITEVAALAINTPATSRLTSTNIRDMMTGKTWRMNAGPAGDSLMISISAAPEDLETGMQLVHAVLTDGKIEDSAFNNWKLRTLQAIEQRSKMPMFEGFKATAELLGGGDPRVLPMTKEKVEKQSLASAQAWFDRLRQNAPIEVAVVGDVQLDQATKLATQYLASLPKRERQAKHLDKLRKLARSTGPLQRDVAIDTMNPQAMAITGCFGLEGRNYADRRAMELAEHVLTSRLVKRIREDLSLVYSIRANSSPSWVYADSGQFGAGAPCDPANVQKVIEEVRKIYADFVANGATPEEIENARKQVANNLDTDMREPGYWLDVLETLDLHSRDLQEEKNEKEAYAKISGEQIVGAFKKYYDPTRQFAVTVVPKASPNPEGGEAAKSEEPKKESK